MKYCLGAAVLLAGAAMWLSSAAAAPFPPPISALRVAVELPDEAAAAELAPDFRRQLVSYSAKVAPGTVIVDTGKTYLYFVLGNGQAIRYGIGVGRDVSPGQASSRSHAKPSGPIGPRRQR